ncbi:glycosyltransferase family 8 protein [Erysipelothrix sp. HDW6A]|uniref:glycosyltransferase family 8 protein n=1 Tax=Erysipelothrix sp. HDW6A TaxID=2714928 RepID=UPI00140C6F73|nr:glycosyltransferase family 8 protein [Erysipelothrix sp. HDW6A]QIK56874.1 glycosyltransferase family 8 protein [Erysipelothrix sp. HDW6A]
MEPIQLLVALDEAYLPQLKVLLCSIKINNPKEIVNVHLIHSSIREESIDNLDSYCTNLSYTLNAITIDDDLLKDAPTSSRYPKEMYYRLLAAFVLPQDMKRILYLDPDILVINALRPLWELDLEGNLFAAAAHTGLTELANTVNRVRLGTDHDYYNSGVLLINLDLAREAINRDHLFEYVNEHRFELLLPDQDVLNGLYGSKTLDIKDELWNYDARKYNSYLVRSLGEFDEQWIIKNTVILHFCGSAKPWKPNYSYRFGILYLHYMKLAEQFEQKKA